MISIRHIYLLLILGLFCILIVSCKKEKVEPYKVMTDIDGNVYHTIILGDQVWMAENLKTTRYRNGDTIAHREGIKWAGVTSGAWCHYNDDEELEMMYGKLYNGHAVKDPRNIAPEGWHVPTAEEWWALSVYVSRNTGISGSLAKALAAKNFWTASTLPNTAGNHPQTNNSTGFNALPGGLRKPDSSFGPRSFDHDGYWWSSGNMVLNINYNNPEPNVLPGSDPGFGYSVRCIKDR